MGSGSWRHPPAAASLACVQQISSVASLKKDARSQSSQVSNGLFMSLGEKERTLETKTQPGRLHEKRRFKDEKLSSNRKKKHHDHTHPNYQAAMHLRAPQNGAHA